MDTKELKKFAQAARRQLRDQVSTKLEKVLKTDSAELREKEKAVQELRKQITETSKEAIIDRVAYTWFNRFCALRFMDVNRYTRMGIVSPSEGFTQPEILAEAKQGHIDDSLDSLLDRQKVFDLLGGRIPSAEPQQEAYRLLLVAGCNYYHSIMPFLFEKIADYTELLMPDDLLSESSILTAVRSALTQESCQDVEVIGWLYQFYISEKKDEVFEGLKKNKKITPENIPAATQLFTPHWIVRYLVENSLGRLWLLNKPSSRLAETMDYYIKPEQSETGFLKITSPEEIKICDPACGSGHMLVYAFELLYLIYEEEGYDPSEIPKLILENNLYGIEIDGRAGALAAFALVMKAREKYKRFFSKPVQPNICVLQNVDFEEGELKSYMDEVGRDLFTVNLQTTLYQFKEADNFGSLIRPLVEDVKSVISLLQEKKLDGNLFLYSTHQKVLSVLKQADFLSPKYHVVIANPPYMGGKGMNGRLKVLAQDQYPDSKSDLFAMFMERNLDLVISKGMIAMITMQSWMFLSSFEKLRDSILENATILSMAHLGARAFDSIGGEVVSTTAFVLGNSNLTDYKGSYLRLVDGNSEDEKKISIQKAIKTPDCAWIFLASASDFIKIPGSPIAYWVTPSFFDIFRTGKKIDDIAPPRIGMMTTDNNRFLRYWFEIDIKKIGFNCSTIDEAMISDTKWFPYNKGGNYRKWAGNSELVVNWYHGGQEIKDAGMTSFRGKEFYFKEGISWGDVSSSIFSCRFTSSGKMFDIKGTSCFPTTKDLPIIMSVLNSKVGSYILNFLNPTISFQSGDIRRVPIPYDKTALFLSPESIQSLINLGLSDWDLFETSWDFQQSPMINEQKEVDSLESTSSHLQIVWQQMTIKMKQIEEENNSILIEAYGLQDELTPEVPLKEITLTCNPYYRYDSKKSEEELEALLLADTMKEFISYAVGCMFGRYSLDKPGLILANQGETVADYFQKVAGRTFEINKISGFKSLEHNQNSDQDGVTFLPDDDNVIPILDEGWFMDDVTERFREFLKVTFGDEHFEENLEFLEKAIGKDIRKYFLNDFYNDHVKRYKKRPIYWLFSSPKGSFNALIYMHRYRSDTVSIVLNDYLREFRTKLSARKEHLEQVNISASASPSEKTKALKDIEKLKKVIEELEDYEREVLYPLATQQIEIDLDDGVKVNYNKFGNALKKITGLSGK